MLEKELYNYEMKTQSDFQNIYESKIIPLLQIYETKRKKRLKKVKLYFLGLSVFIIAAIAFYIWMCISDKCTTEATTVLVVSLFFFITVTILASINENSKFKTDLNYACANDILNVAGNIKLTETSLITDDLINKSKLFKSYNVRKDKIAFSGNFAEKQFDILRTDLFYKTTRYTRSGRRTSCEKSFSGVVVNIKSNKMINKIIKLVPKGTKKKEIRKEAFSFGILFSFVYIALFSKFTGKTNLVFQEADLYLFILIAGLLLINGIIFAIAYSKTEKTYKQQLQFDEGYEISTFEFVETNIQDILNPGKNFETTNQISTEANIPDLFYTYLDKLKTAFNTKTVSCSIFKDNILIQISSGGEHFSLGNLYSKLTNKKNAEAFLNELLSICLTVLFVKMSNDKNEGFDI